MFSFLQKLRGTQSENLGESRITLKISGMHCTSCALNIDGTLEDLPGVLSASTSYAKGQVEVVFDEKKITQRTLQDVVQKLGYQVPAAS